MEGGISTHGTVHRVYTFASLNGRSGFGRHDPSPAARRRTARFPLVYKMTQWMICEAMSRGPTLLRWHKVVPRLAARWMCFLPLCLCFPSCPLEDIFDWSPLYFSRNSEKLLSVKTKETVGLLWQDKWSEEQLREEHDETKGAEHSFYSLFYGTQWFNGKTCITSCQRCWISEMFVSNRDFFLFTKSSKQVSQQLINRMC